MPLTRHSNASVPLQCKPNLLVKGEALGVEEPEGAGLFRAVRGLPLLLVLRPPLSLRRSRPLLGSELGVDKPGVPDVLRCRGAGDDTLDCTCKASRFFLKRYKDHISYVTSLLTLPKGSVTCQIGLSSQS